MTPYYASYTQHPERNYQIGDFVSNVVWGRPGVMDSYCSMGVYHKGALVAGTLFHNCQPECGVIELTSGATDRRWLTRTVIRHIFHMAFDLIGAQLAVMRVSEHNADMVAIAQRFGFSGVLIPRLRGRDESEWIFTLADDDWRASKWV
jgi:RimJ/RimL family protein N-acetyltransferase